jgi:hypothetical protein
VPEPALVFYLFGVLKAVADSTVAFFGTSLFKISTPPLALLCKDIRQYNSSDPSVCPIIRQSEKEYSIGRNIGTVSSCKSIGYVREILFLCKGVLARDFHITEVNAGKPKKEIKP